MLFNKVLFLILVSFIQTALYLPDLLHNFIFWVSAETLYILAVINNRNVNRSFVFLFRILWNFGLDFLFCGPNSVKSVAVDAAVVIFLEMLALWVVRVVQLAHITLLIFIFDNLVQITLKSEQLKSTAPFAPSPLASPLAWLVVVFLLVYVLFFQHEILQNILDLLPDESFCNRRENDLRVVKFDGLKL